MVVVSRLSALQIKLRKTLQSLTNTCINTETADGIYSLHTFWYEAVRLNNTTYNYPYNTDEK